MKESAQLNTVSERTVSDPETPDMTSLDPKSYTNPGVFDPETQDNGNKKICPHTRTSPRCMLLICIVTTQ